MLFIREIKYFDFMDKGAKIGHVGHAGVELWEQDGLLIRGEDEGEIHIRLCNLPGNAPGKVQAELVTTKGTLDMGVIKLSKGSGILVCGQEQLMRQIEGNLAYADILNIRIVLGEEKEAICRIHEQNEKEKEMEKKAEIAIEVANQFEEELPDGEMIYRQARSVIEEQELAKDVKKHSLDEEMKPVVDFHTHILPGIDDGSASVEESVAMLQVEAKQGIRHVIATPHFYANHDTPERFLKRRAQACMRLREALAEQEELPRVHIGAEVYYFRGISDSEVLQELTIDRKACILIEMPHSPWTDSMYRELEDIYTKRGITPVIAHVDRYIAPLRTHRIPERLAKLPVVVQANASFFIDRTTSRMALKMLRDGKIQLLGSDCHNMRSRKPNLSAAVELIEERLGPEAIEYIRYHERNVLKA